MMQHDNEQQLIEDGNGKVTMETRTTANAPSWKGRVHTLVTAMLVLFLLLATTAAIYHPFETAWPDVVAITKIMNPVGAGLQLGKPRHTRCTEPCNFFTGQYATAVGVAASMHASGESCSKPEIRDNDLLVMVCEKLGVRDVDVAYDCMADPYRIENVTQPPGKFPRIWLNAFLFTDVFRGLSVRALYTALAGFPCLLGMGVPPADALKKILAVSGRRYLGPYTSRDVVEAAVVQSMCAMGVDVDEIRRGLSCSGF